MTPRGPAVSAARATRRAVLAVLAPSLAWPAAPARAADCPAQPVVAIGAPGFAAALRRADGARIIAFGSSSTAGSGASGPGQAYPAQLQARLRAALGQRVAVLNRGRGGEDGDAMVGRLARDVIADRPDLVIWQLGANAALRRMDPEAFARAVRRGVGMLRQAGIDVVLMDNQRAPRIAASPGHRRFDAILAEVAATTPGVTLFSRGALMDGWAAAGLPSEALLVPDGLHHNDRGYACLADALAAALLAGLPAQAARAP
jgi:lysophospholipase L1-like esterase